MKNVSNLMGIYISVILSMCLLSFSYTIVSSVILIFFHFLSLPVLSSLPSFNHLSLPPPSVPSLNPSSLSVIHYLSFILHLSSILSSVFSAILTFTLLSLIFSLSFSLIDLQSWRHGMVIFTLKIHSWELVYMGRWKRLVPETLEERKEVEGGK